MVAVRFLTNAGMPAKAISEAAGVYVELIDPSNHMGRAQRANAMVNNGIAVTSSWCPILKQWKCSGTGNPAILLTCQSAEDLSQLFLPNIGKQDIVRMAAAGIKYVQANLAKLVRDQFVEVRLCRGATTTTTQLFHVDYPRPRRRVELNARAPFWVQERHRWIPDSELKLRLLHPRTRKDVAQYLVGENGTLTQVR